jgi:hypothetical protein
MGNHRIPSGKTCGRCLMRAAAAIGGAGDDPYAEPPGGRTGNRRPFSPISPLPFNQPASLEPIWCRICECQIPQWYFEKRSALGRGAWRPDLESVAAQLQNCVRDLSAAADHSSSSLVAISEDRGMPIFSPSTSPSVSSPLQLFRFSARAPRKCSGGCWNSSRIPCSLLQKSLRLGAD